VMASEARAVLTAALDAMLEHATPVLRRTLAGPPGPDVEDDADHV
jgi:hypothetical protein